jgi:hypothetical protein
MFRKFPPSPNLRSPPKYSAEIHVSNEKLILFYPWFYLYVKNLVSIVRIKTKLIRRWISRPWVRGIATPTTTYLWILMFVQENTVCEIYKLTMKICFVSPVFLLSYVGIVWVGKFSLASNVVKNPYICCGHSSYYDYKTILKYMCPTLSFLYSV